MRTRKDEILELIFAPLGLFIVVASLLFVGGMATSCKSSIGVQQYQADFEKAEPLNALPIYTGDQGSRKRPFFFGPLFHFCENTLGELVTIPL